MTPLQDSGKCMHCDKVPAEGDTFKEPLKMPPMEELLKKITSIEDGKFPQPMGECWHCYADRVMEGLMKQCIFCKGTGQLPAPYWCGKCGEPVSYSPANYASRPMDIPNPCEKCYPRQELKWIDTNEKK